MSKKKNIKDADGQIIKAGDVINFSYGIPPIGVRAPIILENGELVAITKGHNPEKCTLKELEGYVGGFYKELK